ncbi:MAG TPA: DUF885 domain-containing protein [Bryobacteraceae bacterium]|nr:DUF885 domain-containing protein [Bryobacteraceae bacterium]
MKKLAAVLCAVILAAGCSRNPSASVARLSEEFVYTTLSFSPSTATSVGLHEYKGQHFDDLLDDFSPATLDRHLRFYKDFDARLSQLKPAGLSAEDAADAAIVHDQCTLAELELAEIRSDLHNPTVYVETLGNALFSPMVLDFAPFPERLRHIIARLGRVPLFLDQASTNLVSAPAVWTKVAMDENAGNIDLVDKTLRAKVPPELEQAFSAAAEPALTAMRKFQTYLHESLLPRQADWRLGGDLYTRKFRATMETGGDPDALLITASRELTDVRAHMLEIALPLHRQMEPDHKDHAELSGDERINRVVGEVLARIAGRHATRESYLDDARQDLAEARAFVGLRHLLTLPSGANLQVIPTPEFLRGLYAVGGFNPAPALEPQLGAFYWVTPIPGNWPQERVESKLREYNFYKLKLLTIHEAMPGHYVQFEFANSVEPKARRLLRSIYGNGPYIEGWGQYSEQTMLDEGFLNHSPEMELTFAKERLRVIANAILDIRLQMLGMSDPDALELMEKQTFQEHEEAVEKLQRAKLSSCQLPTYFAGWNGWLDARQEYRQGHPSADLASFHGAALKQGAVPLSALSNLLGDSRQQTAGNRQLIRGTKRRRG